MAAAWKAVPAKDRNRDFADLIRDLERRFPVTRWVAGNDGVHLWPIVRLHLYNSFFDSQFFAGESVRAGTIRLGDVVRLTRKVLGSLAGYSRARLVDAKHSQKIDCRYDVLCLNYHTYMTLVGGSWYSRLVDPIVLGLSNKGLSCLMLTAGYEYAVPRASEAVFIQPQLAMHRLRGILSGEAETECRTELTELETYVRASSLFSASFELVAPVARHLKQLQAISRYFKRVLSVTAPSAVFVTCWYNTESMACILACHELGIPSIDVQHGSQGDAHIAYGQWNSVPPEGYELLPTLFWCWSESEVTAIRRWCAGLPVHQPVVAGNLFLERWVSGQDAMVRSYDKLLASLKESSNNRAHILYTLNGVTKNELGTLLEVIDGINRSGIEAHFWVRLHPVTIDQKDRVRRALTEHAVENVDVENATRLPLYAILRHVDLHVTEFSSVVLEAESFQVPSVLIGELGVLGVQEQIDSGWAVPVDSMRELVDAVKEELSQRSPRAARRVSPVGSSVSAIDRLVDYVSEHKHGAGVRDLVRLYEGDAVESGDGQTA